MTQAEKSQIFFSIVFAGLVLLNLFVRYHQYQKARMALFARPDAMIVSPSKPRFLFSWFMLFLAFYIPITLLFRIFRAPDELFWVIVFLLPIAQLIDAIPAYLYYSIAVYDNKVEGGHLLGAYWKRTYVKLENIVKKQTLLQKILHRLGIIVFRSTSGRPILTFGLDDFQVAQILTSTSNGKS